MLPGEIAGIFALHTKWAFVLNSSKKSYTISPALCAQIPFNFYDEGGYGLQTLGKPIS
jgi:hypothetical protein